jgi:hypothetical protein
LLIISKLRIVINGKNYPIIHNHKTNFDKILDIIKSFFQDSIDADVNYYYYPNKPKMFDCEIITLPVLCESIGIDSENYLLENLNLITEKIFPILLKEAGLTKGGSDWEISLSN